MSKRLEFSKTTKLQAWLRSGGYCEKCQAKLSPGKFQYHHDLESTFPTTATQSIGNCIVLCTNCHVPITAMRAGVIAKSNRIRLKHAGIKRRSRALPFGKNDRLKRKITGEIVPR